MENNYKKGYLLAKTYFYIQRGLSFVNDFKYLVAGIMALYFMLKLENIAWFVVMFLLSIPLLIILGWLMVHKLAKVIDWLGVEYGTYWSRYQFTLQEKILKELEKINGNK